MEILYNEIDSGYVTFAECNEIVSGYVTFAKCTFAECNTSQNNLFPYCTMALSIVLFNSWIIWNNKSINTNLIINKVSSRAEVWIPVWNDTGVLKMLFLVVSGQRNDKRFETLTQEHPCGQSKWSCLHVNLQVNSSSTDCARELFKPSKDSASLRVCSEKFLLILHFRFFVSGIISGKSLGLFGQLHLAPGPNC